MTWVVIAVTLLAWLAGIVLRLGQWVNLFLLLAAVLIVHRVIQERRSAGE